MPRHEREHANKSAHKPARKHANPAPPPPSARLAKLIARAGIASRRKAEEIIRAGRVRVNGERIDSPAFNASFADHITVDDKPIEEPPLRLWRFHKPRGVIVSARDEAGRETIYALLPKELGEARAIGRLDYASEGLLLLTNDGELKRRLELPKTGWSRRYKVRAFGHASEKKLDLLRDGVTIDDERFRPIGVKEMRRGGENAWYEVELKEGRNREIRRAFSHIGLEVNRLIRTGFGPFELGDLAKGKMDEVRPGAITASLGALFPKHARLAPSHSAPKRQRAGSSNNAKTNSSNNSSKKPGASSRSISRKRGPATRIHKRNQKGINQPGGNK